MLFREILFLTIGDVSSSFLLCTGERSSADNKLLFDEELMAIKDETFEDVVKMGAR